MKLSPTTIEKPDEIHSYDNTMIQNFLNCPRYYYWRHVRHLVSTRPAVQLTFGIAVHSALETYYKGAGIEAALNAFAESWTAANIEGTDRHNLENGLGILTHYFGFYPVEQEAWDVKHVELPMEMQLRDNYYYFGKIDLVVLWRDYGYLVIDHKTTGIVPNDTYMTMVNPGRQFTGYIIYLTEWFENVYGAMLNAIYVNKASRQCARAITTRSEEMMATWVVETLDIIKSIERHQESSIWPQNTGFCTKWNRRCEYYDLCTQRCHPHDVRIHPGDFNEDPWIPFALREGA